MGGCGVMVVLGKSMGEAGADKAICFCLRSKPAIQYSMSEPLWY